MPAGEARERGPRERHVHEMHVHEMHVREIHVMNAKTFCSAAEVRCTTPGADEATVVGAASGAVQLQFPY
jgi:hypothetical protein